MRFKVALAAFVTAAALIFATACRQEAVSTNESAPNSGPISRLAAPIPDRGFKAEMQLIDPPAKLRSGEKVTVKVRSKNASDLQWYARGGEVNTNPDNRFYIAVANRWLKADGEQLVTNMDGRYGLPKDLKPGEEVEVPLQITAPANPGEYILEVDLVQEQVAWFSDKGSQTARVKVTVVR